MSHYPSLMPPHDSLSDAAALRRRLAERSALLANLERRMAECKADIENRRHEHRRLADRYNDALCTFMYLFRD